MRVAAIADLHYQLNSAGTLRRLLGDIEGDADALVLAGDITDKGRIDEMDVLIDDLGSFDLPVFAVLGNHDHECDHAVELIEMLRGRDVFVLENNAVELDGVGFVGTKGFCGGFDGNLIEPFGERAIKEFTQESIDESARLANTIAGLECRRRLAILHYSPVKETLEGESPELYAFLGTSRLAEAIDRHGVDFVVHGHSHHGSPRGRTPGGIPVHNVSRFVQGRTRGKPYCMLEV